jgi:hypothetical protein
MKEPTTRADKIKFLKSLQKGTISLKDLQPTGEIWLYNSQNEYLNTTTGLWITEEKFKALGVGGILLPHNYRDYDQRG